MSKIIKQDDLGFLIKSDAINSHALAKVNKYLPELIEKTKAFGSKNSQTSLSLMSLTMLNGHSPYRLLRQILAEVEKRKSALSEAQLSHAKAVSDVQRLQNSENLIEQAKYRQRCVTLETLEQKINGSITDIATLIEAYNNIKEINGIKDWDETAFEAEEKKHHVRRCFELVYRDVLTVNRIKEGSIEYCQQFGIHPQIALTEVSIYINSAAQQIENNTVLHSNDLEEFLDQMADKYVKNVDATCERLFGKAEFTNKDHMYDMMKQRFST